MKAFTESQLSLINSSRRIAILKKTAAKPRFTRVYGEHRNNIYSYVFYRVGCNREVAEDITSEVFLKAYRNYDSYDETYAMTTWLYTIAKRTLIDHYRKHKDMVELAEYEHSDETDPLYRLISENISQREVADAIAALPEIQQICLTEQFFGGKSAKQVAKEHDLSHAAARKHVSRAIATLRDMLLGLILVLF
jgi:RNA polymerase sigma-70 factor (ECF subfamily)